MTFGEPVPPRPFEAVVGTQQYVRDNCVEFKPELPLLYQPGIALALLNGTSIDS
jgi:hypothetical protein